MIMTSLKITKMTEICCPATVHIVQSAHTPQDPERRHLKPAAPFAANEHSLESAAAPIFSISSTLLVTNVGADINIISQHHIITYHIASNHIISHRLQPMSLPTSTSSYHRGQNLYHLLQITQQSRLSLSPSRSKDNEGVG